MKTIVSSPLHTGPVVGAAPRSRHRISMMLVAFWHTLRRDMMVTAREFIPFLVQVLVMPISLLAVFGSVLPGVGITQQVYPALFFPGIVGLTIFMASIQGITITLMMDLSYNREIDDRLLAPIPVSLVAIEKVVYASVRAMVAGLLIFPAAYVVLGSGFQVRTDALVPLFVVMLLYALSSSALGLIIGAALPAEKIYLLFTLVVSATLYTGCVYYTWQSISSIRVLQLIALINPLTYASEGLRYAMVPAAVAYTPLPFGAVLLGLSISFLIFLVIGILIFHKRVIS